MGARTLSDSPYTTTRSGDRSTRPTLGHRPSVVERTSSVMPSTPKAILCSAPRARTSAAGVSSATIRPPVDDHPRGHTGAGLLDVVRRQEDRLPPGPHVPDEVPGRVTRLWIEPAGQLVEEDQPADRRSARARSRGAASGPRRGRQKATFVLSVNPRPSRIGPGSSGRRVEGREQAHGLADPQPGRQGALPGPGAPHLFPQPVAVAARVEPEDAALAPPLGARSPFRHSIVVVFPAPFGPTTPKISPWATSNEIASTARTDP